VGAGLGGRDGVGGEVEVDAGGDPEGVDGEVGEVGEDGHVQAAGEPEGAEDLAGTGVGGDDGAGVRREDAQGAFLGAAQQGPYGGARAAAALGARVHALVRPRGEGQQPVIAAADQRAEPGGKEVEQVVPVDGVAGGAQAGGEFGGGAVVAGSDARGDDHDAAGAGRGNRHGWSASGHRGARRCTEANAVRAGLLYNV
jgi:hypothetical protein